VVAVQGVVQVPQATGLGHAVDRELIVANTVAELSVGPEQE
jgi:O-succinylbenzoate synthase